MREKQTGKNRETEIDVKYGDKAVKRQCSTACVCSILLLFFTLLLFLGEGNP